MSAVWAIVAGMLGIVPAIPYACGAENIEAILKAYRDEVAEWDVVMPDQKEARQVRLRQIVERYETLGEEGERQLCRVFEDQGSEGKGNRARLALALFDNSSKSFGPMLDAIRQNLRNVVSSGFEYAGRETGLCIDILAKRGDNEDADLLGHFARSPNPIHAQFAASARKEILSRVREAGQRDSRQSKGSVSGETGSRSVTEGQRAGSQQDTARSKPNERAHAAWLLGVAGALLALAAAVVIAAHRRSR